MLPVYSPAHPPTCSPTCLAAPPRLAAPVPYHLLSINSCVLCNIRFTTLMSGLRFEFVAHIPVLVTSCVVDWSFWLSLPPPRPDCFHLVLVNLPFSLYVFASGLVISWLVPVVPPSCLLCLFLDFYFCLNPFEFVCMCFGVTPWFSPTPASVHLLFIKPLH